MTAAALHEAAHAAAALFLRGPGAIRVVSVAKAIPHEGVTVLSSRALDFGGHHGSPVTADPELRAATEREIVIILAGRAAESLLAPRTGYVAGPPSSVVEAVTRLAPRDVELLARAEARPAPSPLADPDREDAEALAERLAGDEVGAYLGWLEVVARRFVVRHAEPIRRLAAALDARTTIPGPQAENILQGGSEWMNSNA